VLFFFGQISVTSSDLLGLIGKSGIIESDTSGSIIVSPGPSGGNQSWDFSSIILNSHDALIEFLDPQNTPYSDNFPTANFAWAQKDIDDDVAQGYSYVHISEASFHQLGFAFFSDSLFVDNSEEEMVPLPLAYGSSWETVTSNSFGVDGFMIINKDSSFSEVDAWGTITVPAGTFDCLRIRDNRTHYQQTIINNVLMSSDTSTTIEYDWITKDNFSVAYIGSQQGETEANFSVANEMDMLSSVGATAISGDPELNTPKNFELFQNYPNPFNPETVIKFQITQTENVRIDVYDLNGKWVTTLLNGQKSAGSYFTIWNGKNNNGINVASGVYYYALSVSGKYAQSQKMTLIR